VGVLVLIVMLSWYLGAFSQHSVAGVQGLYQKAGLLPAALLGLVGVDAAEHLVPSYSIHHDVLPCRGFVGSLGSRSATERSKFRSPHKCPRSTGGLAGPFIICCYFTAIRTNAVSNTHCSRLKPRQR
jgi:hypothetical protein